MFRIPSSKYLVPLGAAALHADTGMRKTFVAAALALDKLTFCIVLPNSTRQWATQATLFSISGIFFCRCPFRCSRLIS